VNAWICPKCGRVWGPLVMECKPCNAPVVVQTGTNTYTPPTPECDTYCACGRGCCG